MMSYDPQRPWRLRLLPTSATPSFGARGAIVQERDFTTADEAQAYANRARPAHEIGSLAFFAPVQNADGSWRIEAKRSVDADLDVVERTFGSEAEATSWIVIDSNWWLGRSAAV